MKAITAIGIGVAFAALFLAAIMEGTNPVTFLNIPALILITGGTVGATMASTNFRSFMTAPKAAIMSFKGTSINSAGSIGQMVELSEKARRNGLLALEEDVAKIDDAFTRKGLQLVVDGTDSDLVACDPRVRDRRPRRASRAGARACSRPPAASPRRSASSARSWASSTSSRTWPRRPSSARRSPARSSPRCTASSSANLLLLPIGNKLKEMSAVELNHRDDGPGRRSCRSRPATTRASWPRSSSRFVAAGRPRQPRSPRPRPRSAELKEAA